MKKILLGISLLFTLSQADSHIRHGYMVTSPHHSRFATKTIYRNNTNYRATDRRHYASHRRNDRIIGTLIGGVIGGILGNQISRGRTRGIATMGGIVIGSLAGANLSRRGYNRRYIAYEPHRRWRHNYRRWNERRWRHHHRRYINNDRIVIFREYR